MWAITQSVTSASAGGAKGVACQAAETVVAQLSLGLSTQ
jgi:hypothetical protein